MLKNNGVAALMTDSKYDARRPVAVNTSVEKVT